MTDELFEAIREDPVVKVPSDFVLVGPRVRVPLRHRPHARLARERAGRDGRGAAGLI